MQESTGEGIERCSQTHEESFGNSSPFIKPLFVASLFKTDRCQTLSDAGPRAVV